MRGSEIARLVAASIALSACGQGAAAGIDAITAYAGTWQWQMTHYDTPFSKARHEANTIRNDCWRSGEFYACHQYVNGQPGALIVYYYVAKQDRYAIHTVMPGDSRADDGRLLIRGNVWTYPWTQADKGGTTYFRVVNVFRSADSIEFRSEYSTDQVHWVRMATGRERKVAVAPAG